MVIVITHHILEHEIRHIKTADGLVNIIKQTKNMYFFKNVLQFEWVCSTKQVPQQDNFAVAAKLVLRCTIMQKIDHIRISLNIVKSKFFEDNRVPQL